MNAINFIFIWLSDAVSMQKTPSVVLSPAPITRVCALSHVLLQTHFFIFFLEEKNSKRCERSHKLWINLWRTSLTENKQLNLVVFFNHTVKRDQLFLEIENRLRW